MPLSQLPPLPFDNLDRKPCSSSSATTTTTTTHKAISLTIRYLPTDEWRTLDRVDPESKVGELKRFALEAFTGHRSPALPESGPLKRERRGKREDRLEEVQGEKENLDRDGRLSIMTGPTGGISSASTCGRDKKSSADKGGVKRFANALRDRLSSQHVTSSTSGRTTSSPLRPLNISMSNAPLTLSVSTGRRSVSTTPTPTATSFACASSSTSESPTRQRVRETHETHSRRSSIAGYDATSLVALSTSTTRSLEPDDVETLVGAGKLAASPARRRSSTSARIRRSKSLSDKRGLAGNGSSLRAATGFDETNLANWALVNAITGGIVPEHASVGSRFVESDLLTLKPHFLAYDPPLHLYHLPFLSLPNVAVSAAALSTSRPSSSSSTASSSPGHSRRKSLGGSRNTREDWVDRRLEVCVDDGFFAKLEGDASRTPGTTMVLKVIKVNRLEAIYPLPPHSARLVDASPSSSPSVPPLPPSSSTTNFASLVLPANSPSLNAAASNLSHQSVSPLRLSWEGGQTLTVKAKDGEDQSRLLHLLGEATFDEEEEDERIAESRKDLVDLAFAARHKLFARPPTSGRPAIRDEPTTPARRPPHVRSATSPPDVRLPALATLTPPVPSIASQDPTPTRSSVLHIRKRASTLASETPVAGSPPRDRTPSGSSVSVSDSPATPRSYTFPEPGQAHTIITPASPLPAVTPPGPSPVSLLSTSSSYFSLHSLPPPPPSLPKRPSFTNFSRAKSSLDLSSSLRSTSPLGSSSESSIASDDSKPSRNRMVRRVTSALDKLS
ncbi:hypothetical protein JCM10212_004442 [Sporobolomyces blumeae]